MKIKFNRKYFFLVRLLKGGKAKVSVIGHINMHIIGKKKIYIGRSLIHKSFLFHKVYVRLLLAWLEFWSFTILNTVISYKVIDIFLFIYNIIRVYLYNIATWVKTSHFGGCIKSDFIYIQIISNNSKVYTSNFCENKRSKLGLYD